MTKKVIFTFSVIYATKTICCIYLVKDILFPDKYISMSNTQRFIYLFDCYAEKKYSEAEKKEFFEMISSEEYDNLFGQLVEERLNMPVPEWLRERGDEKAETVFENVLKHIQEKHEPGLYNKVIQLKRVSIAAAIVVALCIASYFIFFKPSTVLPTLHVGAETIDDVNAPTSSRATITLADGSTVYLDSIKKGQLALQAGIQLIKLQDGQIAYRLSAAQAGTATGEIINKITYNTLTNPRGSKVIDMQFSDGSHVWLNAGSSVTFPVVFTGNERRVELTGEGYFEVAKYADKKFIVTANGTTTEVLGTHFNINAYEDEGDIKVTLLEGAVKVSNHNNSKFVQPGQQAVIHHSSFIINHSIDTEQVMAWKNGIFKFNEAGIEEVMRQVARWYDVEVKYTGKAPTGKFEGKIGRELTLNQLLSGLSSTRIKYRLEKGKTITILPE